MPGPIGMPLSGTSAQLLLLALVAAAAAVQAHRCAASPAQTVRTCVTIAPSRERRPSNHHHNPHMRAARAQAARDRHQRRAAVLHLGQVVLTHARKGIVGTVCCGPNHTHGRCADSWTACLRAASSLTCTLPAFPDYAPLPRLPCLISALEVPYISASWALNRIVTCEYPYLWLKIRAGGRGTGVGRPGSAAGCTPGTLWLPHTCRNSEWGSKKERFAREAARRALQYLQDDALTHPAGPASLVLPSAAVPCRYCDLMPSSTNPRSRKQNSPFSFCFP